MTTTSMSLKREGTPAMLNPCTRLTCRSSTFRSCTFRLCVLVLCCDSGVKSVPFRHTWTAWTPAPHAAALLFGRLCCCPPTCRAGELKALYSGDAAASTRQALGLVALLFWVEGTP